MFFEGLRSRGFPNLIPLCGSKILHFPFSAQLPRILAPPAPSTCPLGKLGKASGAPLDFSSSAYLAFQSTRDLSFPSTIPLSRPSQTDPKPVVRLAMVLRKENGQWSISGHLGREFDSRVLIYLILFASHLSEVFKI